MRMLITAPQGEVSGRRFPEYGMARLRQLGEVQSLSLSSIGLIELDSADRNPMASLRSFSVRVHVYDPYLTGDALNAWGFAPSYRCTLRRRRKPITGSIKGRCPGH